MKSRSPASEIPVEAVATIRVNGRHAEEVIFEPLNEYVAKEAAGA